MFDKQKQLNYITTMIILDTPEKIDMARFLARRSALKLECLGMRGRGQSAYSIVKAEYGFKGNKKSVLSQMEQIIKEFKEG